MLNRTIFISILMLTTFRAKAHQPDLSSTILAEQSKNEWVLQVRSALTAFEYEIENRYGSGAYDTPEEFQKLVIQHVRENLAVHANNHIETTFTNGMVKLGHETMVTFKVNGIPENMEWLEVRNSSFRNISRNQSALIVYKESFQKDQFRLDRNNDHTVKLKVANSKFELMSNPANNINTVSYIPILIGGLLLIILFISYIILYRKKSIRMNGPSLHATN